MTTIIKKIAIAVIIVVIAALAYVFFGGLSPEEIRFAEEPVVCTMEYAPVCGVDGKTYGNRCVAEQQNKVQVDYERECI